MIPRDIAWQLFIAVFAIALHTCANAAGPFPDPRWAPTPLAIPADTKARYIDFDQGSDNNPGTRAAPWKHHPWDPAATGNARGDHNTSTFYFKKGVIYRGRLVARRSGTKAKPIVLGVKPDWGSGSATISGAHLAPSRWHLCSAVDSQRLPPSSVGKTWCLDVSSKPPQALWGVSGGKATRIVLARQPNWSNTYADDPRADWGVLTGTRMQVRLTTDSPHGFAPGDTIHFVGPRDSSCNCVVGNTGQDFIDIDAPEGRIKGLKSGAIISNGRSKATIKHAWGAHQIIRQLTAPALTRHGPHTGAIVWVESSYMPKPYAGVVTSATRDTIESKLHLPPGYGPKPFNRYFLEGLLNYLDTPGEFAVEPIGPSRLRFFLRMPRDADPNQWHIEIPQEDVLLDINDRRHIRIAGLEFVYGRQIPAGTFEAQYATLKAAAIEIRGNSSDIRIDHNRMLHLPAGIVASPDPKMRRAQTLDMLSIEDNDLRDIEGSAIALTNGESDARVQNTGSRLVHVSVLRNRIVNNGYRTLAHWSVGANGPAIEVTGGELVNVAGNHVRHTWGSGIVVLMGSDYSRGHVVRPLIRGLVDHNVVVDSVLGLQDYGGIASFMGGPLYMYDNISGNAVGYRYRKQHTPPDGNPLRHNSFAAAYYFDGQYKGYCFNNIGWGKNNDIRSPIYNSVGFNEAMGFMNAVFNNTFYRVAAGLHKDMPQHNRCYYLGNLFADIGYRYIQNEVNPNAIDYSTLAYGHNVFNGDVDAFGQLGAGRRNVFQTLSAWTDNLREHGAMQADTGVVVAKNPLPGAQDLDFRPAPSSNPIAHRVRFFVPWGLARVVGEWNFYAAQSHPQRVTDESININSEWTHRSMFAQIPRRDLACLNISARDYVMGTLEDWIRGALNLDGRRSYCHVDHAASQASYEWHSGFGKGRISGAQRETLDIGRGNLTIEAVIRPRATGRSAGLLGKLGDSGYSVHITSEGHLLAALKDGKNGCERVGKSRLTDGKWHHVLIVVDRQKRDGITIFVDGHLDNGAWRGQMSTATLRNESDFTIGRVGAAYYAGDVDFVRIAKSTLHESETSIDELYKWEFDGPATRDFNGSRMIGSARNAGAISSVARP